MVTIRTIRLPDALGAEYGQLLFDDGVLIAVVACLAYSGDDDCERWNIEASFLPELKAGTEISDLDAWIALYERASVAESEEVQ
jgi:hypothetical protein